MISALTSHYRAAARGARVVRRDGNGAEICIDLTVAGLLIGRGLDCAIRTDDQPVSRRHCRISFSGGRWCIEDLASANGTFVNGERITRAALSHGDVIRCGSLEVRFVDAIDVPQTAPPTLALGDGMVALPPVDMRADNLRQRIGDLERREAQHDEEVRVLTQLGQQLREDLRERDEELERTKPRVAELQDELQARDRQLERAHEEAEASRQLAEGARAELAAQRKRADEGWRELNVRGDELENMRRIMSEQERLLEERHVGLTALEAALQQLRAERERWLRDNAACRLNAAALQEQLSALQKELESLAPAKHSPT